MNKRIQNNEKLLKSSFNRKEFESFITETNLQIEKLKTDLNTIDNKPINRINRNKKSCKDKCLEIANLSYRSTSLNDARNKKNSNNNIIKVNVNLEMVKKKLNELKILNIKDISRISRSNERE